LSLPSSKQHSLHKKYFTHDFNSEVGREPRLSSQCIQDLAKLEHNTRKKVHMQMWIQLIFKGTLAFAILFSFLQLLVI